ncbi:hypothetical protein OOT00_14175 [Desulfobotulus sp. H1]|uniref:Uncharacterized protein n=1 Tax=Desulfobotulus pelophilus TaxID=2823377 RepID=A0ABT3ND57_9BACT|nr:hypothetical protein [Desulfobotulus pelophilus]MCW7755131.1 hypothetical protein [Desulfobotulus pelophilus]
MAELLFPNDTPLITGMSSFYLSLQRLVEHYQGVAGCGCIHGRSASAEALLYFDKQRLVNAVFEDKKGRSTGTSATDLLMKSMPEKNFRVSVYGIQPDALSYWVSLIHVVPMAKPVILTCNQLLPLLDKEHENRPFTGYLRLQGDKKRQLGWAFFQGKRIYGFRLPGEKAPWMEPEEMPDFIQRFETSSRVETTFWGLSQNVTGENSTQKAPVSAETIEMLQKLIVRTEQYFHNMKKDRITFDIRFRKACVQWAETYDFLDPFVAELDYRDGILSFEGKAGDAQVTEGVCRAVLSMLEESGLENHFSPIFEQWKDEHEKRLHDLQIRFS